MRRRKPPLSGGSCHGKAGTERGHRNTQKSVIANQPAGWCGNPADLPGVSSAAPAPKAPSGRGGCHAKHDWGRRGLFAPRTDWGEIPAAANSLPLPGGAVTAKPGLRGDTATLKKSVIANQPAGWCGNPVDLPGVPSAAPAPKAPSGRGGCHAKHDWGRRELFAPSADWGSHPVRRRKPPPPGEVPQCAHWGGEGRKARKSSKAPPPQKTVPGASRRGQLPYSGQTVWLQTSATFACRLLRSRNVSGRLLSSRSSAEG